MTKDAGLIAMTKDAGLIAMTKDAGLIAMTLHMVIARGALEADRRSNLAFIAGDCFVSHL